MPVYSFVCQVCGTAFDSRAPYKADHHPPACPHGHRNIRRAYSSPPVIFKGQGWYAKDSRSQPTGETT